MAVSNSEVQNQGLISLWKEDWAKLESSSPRNLYIQFNRKTYDSTRGREQPRSEGRGDNETNHTGDGFRRQGEEPA